MKRTQNQTQQTMPIYTHGQSASSTLCSHRFSSSNQFIKWHLARAIKYHINTEISLQGNYRGNLKYITKRTYTTMQGCYSISTGTQNDCTVL